MKRKRKSDFAAYTEYDPPFLSLNARALPFMVATVLVIIGSLAAAFVLRDTHLPAWIMLASIPIIVLMFYFGRKTRCPECKKFLDKYLDIDADTKDTYGFIYVCKHCRHYFQERHRVD